MSNLQLWDEIWVGTDMHIVPAEDLVGHELAEDCPCGPQLVDLNSSTRMLAHYSLETVILRE